MVSAGLAAVTLLVFLSTGLGKPGYGPGEQEYGHIQVRENAKMFYWLFYVQDEQVSHFTERPLVLWFQGGPGGSSTGYGNFAEIGPLDVNGSTRDTSWAKYVNLMFIDNPVGAGFSYVTDPSAYVKNNAEIGADLVEFTRQFYSTFPEFSKTPLYVFCESYGGKMVAEYAKQLDAAIKNENLDIDFRAIALGDSWISPIQFAYSWGPMLYSVGLVDEAGKLDIQVSTEHIRQSMSFQQFEQAADRMAELELYIGKLTSGVDFYNILSRTPYNATGTRRQERDVLMFNHGARLDLTEINALMDGPVREALGVPADIHFDGLSEEVFTALYRDFMLPVTNTVASVLDNTTVEVYVYSGQLDLICSTPGTIEWVEYLRWHGAQEWDNVVTRKPFVVNGVVEGYIKELSRLHLYTIDRAGHMVTVDNPAAGLELLRIVTKYDK